MLKRYQFKIGQRIVLNQPFNIDMSFDVPTGTECVIYGFACDGYLVINKDGHLDGLKLDIVLDDSLGEEISRYSGVIVKPFKHFDELDEWKNEVYVWTSFVDILQVWHVRIPITAESAVKVIEL